MLYLSMPALSLGNVFSGYSLSEDAMDSATSLQDEGRGLEIAAFLQYAISRWLKQKNRRRLSSLSRLSGVPYATLKRLHEGRNDPNMETALGVIGALFSKEEQRHLVKKYYPQLFGLAKGWLQLAGSGVDIE